MGKIDTDLDFRHEQWKGEGKIGENVRKQEKLQDYGEMQRNILCRCSWLDVVCADVACCLLDLRIPGQSCLSQLVDRLLT